jgi:hypothetical protein
MEKPEKNILQINPMAGVGVEQKIHLIMTITKVGRTDPLHRQRACLGRVIQFGKRIVTLRPIKFLPLSQPQIWRRPLFR